MIRLVKIVGYMTMVAKLGYCIMYFCKKKLLDVECNIIEVIISMFQIRESLMFSTLFQRDCPLV